MFDSSFDCAILPLFRFIFVRKKMKVTIAQLSADEHILQQVAEAYRASYNKLSEGYKSKEEMALYTYDYFYQKVKRFAAENAQSNLSRTFMINLDGKPVGLVRYSRIPEYYKHADNGQSKDLEKGYLDGYEYAWYRKVNFTDTSVKLDDSTMILNQIYLHPDVQRHGLGTFVLAHTLPKMKEKGIQNLILEYNVENKNGEKFYQSFGFQPLADTQDLDHIVKNEKGATKFCVSQVKIVHVPVETALQKANAKMAQKKQAKAQTLGNILVGLIKHGKQY